MSPGPALGWLAALLAALACDAPDRAVPAGPGDVRVEVARVGLDRNDLPVVLLGERDGPRELPIWIGSSEAHSIAMRMAERESPRPNTHDLARRLIDGMAAEVERVVVTELRGSTYYATLTLVSESGRVEIDSRPSDAIAIALRTGAPIFVRARLLEEARRSLDEETPSGPAI